MLLFLRNTPRCAPIVSIVILWHRRWLGMCLQFVPIVSIVILRRRQWLGMCLWFVGYTCRLLLLLVLSKIPRKILITLAFPSIVLSFPTNSGLSRPLLARRLQVPMFADSGLRRRLLAKFWTRGFLFRSRFLFCWRSHDTECCRLSMHLRDWAKFCLSKTRFSMTDCVNDWACRYPMDMTIQQGVKGRNLTRSMNVGQWIKQREGQWIQIDGRSRWRGWRWWSGRPTTMKPKSLMRMRKLIQTMNLRMMASGNPSET